MPIHEECASYYNNETSDLGHIVIVSVSGSHSSHIMVVRTAVIFVALSHVDLNHSALLHDTRHVSTF